MPPDQAIGLVLDAVVSASRRGVPLVGMKLDYDLTILDTQAKSWFGSGLADRGWCGPVLDAVVIDRHFDRWRRGRRTLGALSRPLTMRGGLSVEPRVEPGGLGGLFRVRTQR